MSNPYQKIDGVQKGHIDTYRKFEQMTEGIDLNGLRVLDIGCNLGEMSRLAAQKGAKVHGIDNQREFVEDAMKLTEGKNPTFAVQDGYRATGTYDLAILSAAFHYFQDPNKLLERLSRVTQRLRVDVWVHDGEGMKLSHRGLLIPSEELFVTFAKRHFGSVRRVGKVLSPDGSERILYDLQEPKGKPWESLVVHGPGGSGKSTIGRQYAYSGAEHLQLDATFLSWKRLNDKAGFSVIKQTELLKENRWDEYLEHARKYVRRWLSLRQGDDVVIEGYSAIDPRYRKMVKEELKSLGWETTKEIETKRNA
jgi:SAM-dependent methyltransferase